MELSRFQDQQMSPSNPFISSLIPLLAGQKALPLDTASMIPSLNAVVSQSRAAYLKFAHVEYPVVVPGSISGWLIFSQGKARKLGSRRHQLTIVSRFPSFRNRSWVLKGYRSPEGPVSKSHKRLRIAWKSAFDTADPPSPLAAIPSTQGPTFAPCSHL